MVKHLAVSQAPSPTCTIAPSVHNAPMMHQTIPFALSLLSLCLLLISCSSTTVSSVSSRGLALSAHLTGSKTGQHFSLRDERLHTTVGSSPSTHGALSFELPIRFGAPYSSCFSLLDSDTGTPIRFSDSDYYTFSLPSYDLLSYNLNAAIHYHNSIKYLHSLNQSDFFFLWTNGVTPSPTPSAGSTSFSFQLPSDCTLTLRNQPPFSCADSSQANTFALGYCASRTLGCSIANAALSFYDPYGLSDLSCQHASDEILGLDYDLTDYLSGIGTSAISLAAKAKGYNWLALGVQGASKIYDFYSCQSTVSSTCLSRYSDWYYSEYSPYYRCLDKNKQFTDAMSRLKRRDIEIDAFSHELSPILADYKSAISSNQISAIIPSDCASSRTTYRESRTKYSNSSSDFFPISYGNFCSDNEIVVWTVWYDTQTGSLSRSEPPQWVITRSSGIGLAEFDNLPGFTKSGEFYYYASDGVRVWQGSSEDANGLSLPISDTNDAFLTRNLESYTTSPPSGSRDVPFQRVEIRSLADSSIAFTCGHNDIDTQVQMIDLGKIGLGVSQ